MKGALRELALFAGVGGGILGGLLNGWRTVCAVENDPYCIKTLLRRQSEGYLPKFPIWDDVRTFDGLPWYGEVDIITGGFPCQDISAAGKGVGLTGERSKLFFEMLRIIAEVRPRFVLAENSPQLRTEGLGTVVEGLARLGYVGCVGVLGARHVGANHFRDRMWVVATDADRCRKRVESVNAEMGRAPTAHRMAEKTSDLDMSRLPSSQPGGLQTTKPKTQRRICEGEEGRHDPDADGEIVRVQPRGSGGAEREEPPVTRITDWWGLPRFAGVDDGNTDRVDRIRTTGNAQVPAVAALAWEILSGTLKERYVID